MPSITIHALDVEIGGVRYTLTPPVAPPVVPPPPAVTVDANLFLVGGQSNMNNCRSFLSALGLTTFGFSEGAQPISYWDVGANGWTQLAAAIAGKNTAKAFVWFQGETDGLNGVTTAAYQAKLTDLIARVRAITRANLPILLTQISTLEAPFAPINAAITAAAASSGVYVIPTSDLSWGDTRHLDNAGATAWAQRVKDRVV